MCGINGIFGYQQSIVAKEVIGRMNASMSHRGPDAEGSYIDEHLALGNRRLAIIAPNESGNQPIFSFDQRYVISFNGELYNYKALKKQLDDYPFQTETDTEVFLAAYIKWGKSCLEKCNGMFGVGIWDKSEKKLFIARDRLGIKPIYYHRGEKGFVFSSEIRSLLTSGLVPKKIDEHALLDYLRYQTVHAPLTLLADVKMLMPGHYIELDATSFSIVEYWKLRENTLNLTSADEKEVQQSVFELLQEGVKKRMQADVAYGAFLSGGIDSSAIVGLMSQVSPREVKTFSVTFKEKDFNEAPFSQLVAEKFDTHHTEIPLTAGDFLKLVPSALAAMDHPSGDGPNTFVVSKVTKEAGVTMVLSGLGGDELFAGYNVFDRLRSLGQKRWLNHFPVSLRGAVGKLLKAARPSVATGKVSALLHERSLDFQSIYPLLRQVLLDEEIKAITKNRAQLSENSVRGILEMNFPSHVLTETIPSLSKISIAEIATYMQNVLLRDTDQMSMAHSLEVRVPFLDHELVEYVLSVPDHLKRGTYPKALLVKSMGALLPKEIFDRPKMGFTFPWSNWLKGDLHGFAQERIHWLDQQVYFQKGAVTKLWERFKNEDPRVSWSRIWHLVVLADWLNGIGLDDR